MMLVASVLLAGPLAGCLGADDTVPDRAVAVPVAPVCVATGAVPPAADAPASALPSSLDVDLHEYVLNITMPEGQPTMVVALDVTKDMWFTA